MNRIPPQDIPAEEALLGSVLLDNTVMDDLEIDPQDFYRGLHSELFGLMIKLRSKGDPIDAVTLGEFESAYREGNYLVFLSELENRVPASSNFQTYAKRVKDKAIMRRIIILCTQTIQDSYEEDNPRNVLDEFEEAVLSIGENERASDFIPFQKNMVDHLKTVERVAMNSEKPGIMTGFDCIDKILNGLHGGDLIVLAARPAMGKTTLGVNIISNVAEQGHPVGMLSLEMNEDSLRTRIICSRAKVDSSKVRGGSLDPAELKQYIKTAGLMNKLPIYINDDPRTSLLRLKSASRRLVRKNKVKVLLVDYLQLMTAGEKFEGRVNEVSHISRQMKLLAKALNIPIILISQLNRTSVKEKIKPPKLSDLRDSGAIEQDADIVGFLYRKDDESTDTDLIWAKNRSGATGTDQLEFEKVFNRFTEWGVQ